VKIAEANYKLDDTQKHAMILDDFFNKKEMNPFKSSRHFKASQSLIRPIVQNIENFFLSEEFEVQILELQSGAYDISVTKGSQFKAVLGMQSALKIAVRPEGNSIYIEAGVGIFGQQAIPTLITVFVAWPVIIAQMWGMVEQAKLDDKVMEIAEETIARDKTQGAIKSEYKFCTSCGEKANKTAKFCGECGKEFV